MRHILKTCNRGASVVFVVVGAMLATPALGTATPPSSPPAVGKTSGAPTLKERPRRWWLDIYAHSMQERAFIAWMDHLHGGVLWRHTMQEARVEAVWVWWSATHWNTGPTAGAGNTRP